MSGKEEEDSIDIEDEDNDDAEYEPDTTEMVAPRHLAGQEDRIHYQAELPGGGLGSTTAEGEMGKKLKKIAKSTRTAPERFVDNVLRTCRELEISKGIQAAVINLVPKIPDIQFKSASGVIFGIMTIPYIGKRLTSTQKAEFNKIIELIKKLKSKEFKVSELDCVRYARAICLWDPSFVKSAGGQCALIS